MFIIGIECEYLQVIEQSKQIILACDLFYGSKKG